MLSMQPGLHSPWVPDGNFAEPGSRVYIRMCCFSAEVEAERDELAAVMQDEYSVSQSMSGHAGVGGK